MSKVRVLMILPLLFASIASASELKASMTITTVPRFIQQPWHHARSQPHHTSSAVHRAHTTPILAALQVGASAEVETVEHQKKRAPLPTSIETVEHKKDRGNGYLPGSPLYAKQQEKKSYPMDPAVAAVDWEAEEIARSAVPPAPHPRYGFWTFAILICLVGVMVLTCIGAFGGEDKVLAVSPRLPVRLPDLQPQFAYAPPPPQAYVGASPHAPQAYPQGSQYGPNAQLGPQMGSRRPSIGMAPPMSIQASTMQGPYNS